MKIWEHYPRLTGAVQKSHTDRGVCFYCHDFAHVIRVANYATIVAPDEQTGRLAGIAALCHNADRLLQYDHDLGRNGKVNEQELRHLVDGWLLQEEGTFPEDDHDIILEAVLRHSEKNEPDHHPVTITLMDADRLVNVEADVIMRKGQFFGDEVIPTDPVYFASDPNASYRNPKSLLRSLKEDLDLEVEGGMVGLRLPKARAIAKRRFDFLYLYISEVEQQVREHLSEFPQS